MIAVELSLKFDEANTAGVDRTLCQIGHSKYVSLIPK